MYDVDGNGYIDLPEMTKIVRSIYRMTGNKACSAEAYESPEVRPDILTSETKGFVTGARAGHLQEDGREQRPESDARRVRDDVSWRPAADWVAHSHGEMSDESQAERTLLKSSSLLISTLNRKTSRPEAQTIAGIFLILVLLLF